MEAIDITPLLSILKAINPTYAAIALAVWLVFQKVRSQGGLQLGKGGLLSILAQLLGKWQTPDAKPADPVKTPDQKPDAPKDDTDILLDGLAKRIRERLRKLIKRTGNEDAAVEQYAAIVKFLDKNGNGKIDPDELMGVKVDDED